MKFEQMTSCIRNNFSEGETVLYLDTNSSQAEIKQKSAFGNAIEKVVCAYNRNILVVKPM